MVHRAHIITGWRENNRQKTIDAQRPGEKRFEDGNETKGKKVGEEKEREKKTTKKKTRAKKGDIAIRPVTRVHGIPQRGERGGAPGL